MSTLTRMHSAQGIGAYVAQQRELRGLTQAELARRVGVSREWVSRFERGDGSPSLRSVMEVMCELGIVFLADQHETARANAHAA